MESAPRTARRLLPATGRSGGEEEEEDEDEDDEGALDTLIDPDAEEEDEEDDEEVVVRAVKDRTAFGRDGRCVEDDDCCES